MVKNTSKILLGMTCLCSCAQTQKSVHNLPEQGIITEGVILNTCDREEKMYYFEINTGSAHNKPDYAGVIQFGCGKENVETAQRDFPKGAPINLRTSSPRISKLLKISADGKNAGVIFDKSLSQKLERAE